MKHKIFELPLSFSVPERLDLAWGHARKLCFKDAVLDYEAVTSSVDIIRKTRGSAGEWPKGLTLEENQIDLGWHQREFENNTSFAYTIMNNNETECLGCIYIYPPTLRKIVSSDADVDVSFWVTQKMYDAGYYTKLYQELQIWLKTSWPFERYEFSNVEIPKVQN